MFRVMCLMHRYGCIVAKGIAVVALMGFRPVRARVLVVWSRIVGFFVVERRDWGEGCEWARQGLVGVTCGTGRDWR